MYEFLHRRLPISDRLERIGAVHPERLVLGGAIFGALVIWVGALVVILRY